ncbi:hypothetical protein RBB50_005571 [Rhinocladiella similis]
MERIQAEAIAKAWASVRDTVGSFIRCCWKRENSPHLGQEFKVELEALYETRAFPDPGLVSAFSTLLTSFIHGCARECRRSKQAWERPRSIQDREHVSEMIVKQAGSFPPPVFTHGNLNPSNILARGAKIVGIIDWEFSRWYPRYWEYTSAWYGNLTRVAWQQELPKFLEADEGF